MLKNYFSIVWRTLWKNKALSAINLGGLAIGIASSILLLSYVAFQFSYDNFHDRKKDIYRVNMDFYGNGQLAFRSAENYSPVGPALKKDFPEVVEQARLYNMGYKNNCVFSYGNNNFRETKFLYADESFLTIFSFPFLEGDLHSALTQPYTAVISESTARKLFGDWRNALGKSIQMNDDDRNSELCRITGVFRDITDNAHLKFNILISYPTLYHRGNNGIERFEQTWDRKDFYTYVLLRPGTDPASLTSKLPAFVSRHIPGEKSQHIESRLSLQALNRIHLDPSRTDEPEPTGQGKSLGFLVIIAFFIITIAWVNYINLATAGSVNRAREVGIRKVLGSHRGQLIRQFLIESLSLNTVSLLLAVFLILVSRPFIYRLFSVNFSFLSLFTNTYGLIFLIFLLLGAFFSGLYPALVLSSFKPITVLKGKLKTSGKGLFLRKSLVVFQFSLSILLIIGTFIVYQQVHYMLSQDLGMKTSQIMVLDRPGRWDTARSTHNLMVQRFKETLLSDPGVASVGMSEEIPGKEIRWPSSYVLKNATMAGSIRINTAVIDEHYLSTLGMEILAGRNFSAQFKTDRNGLIVTKSAAKLLGFSVPLDAIGKEFRSDDANYTVVGVVNDFYQLSLQNKQTPAAFQFNGGDLREFEYYLVKLKPVHIGQTIDHIQSAWNNNFKGNPFTFSFLDENFNRQYRSDIQFGILFGIFSLLAIVIASIGLFALVAFMIRQRTKEIGVRKILGAGTQDVLYLLTKDYIRLVVLSNLIAWPAGWLLMNHWLEGFANRIHISLLVFVLSGFIVLLIALFTISFQAMKAALTKPVESLRTE